MRDDNLKKILIINLGSIGLKYLKIIQKNWPDMKIACVSSINPKKLILNGVKVFNTLDKGINWEPSGAIIASPASKHLSQAIILSEAGIPILIEKPLATGSENKAQFDKLIKLSKDNVIYLGYVLKQSPCAKFLKKMLYKEKIGKLIIADFYCSSWLPSWRNDKDYRESVSAKKSLGGGILLEMSHEIDMAIWLLNEIEIIGSFVNNSKILEIDDDIEDTALVLAKNKANVGISIRLNFCSQNENRVITINGEKGVLIWDLFKNKVIFKDKKHTEIFTSDIHIKDLYKIQLEDFFSCIKDQKFDNNLKAGVKVLELIRQINHPKQKSK